MTACLHAHGEYDDTYRHCTDCGREWVLIGGEWFEVEAWVRLSAKFLEDVERANGVEVDQG